MEIPLSGESGPSSAIALSRIFYEKFSAKEKKFGVQSVTWKLLLLFELT
jgi:hypothetical protein